MKRYGCYFIFESDAEPDALREEIANAVIALGIAFDPITLDVEELDDDDDDFDELD